MRVTLLTRSPAAITHLRLLLTPDEAPRLVQPPRTLMLHGRPDGARIAAPYSARAAAWLAAWLQETAPTTHAALDMIDALSTLVTGAPPVLPDTVPMETPLSPIQVDALVTLGVWRHATDPDGWAVRRRDGSVWTGGRLAVGAPLVVLSSDRDGASAIHAHAA